MSGTSPDTIPHCYRHPDRETYISCQRCGRPICPDCMRQASVGFQCPECVRQGQGEQRQPRTAFGGRIPTRADAVTIGLIVVNVVCFVIARATGGFSGWFGRLMAMAPDSYRIPTSQGIFTVEGVADGAYWRLITSTFLHTEIFHIALNMFALWIFGSFVEAALGRIRFLSLYLLCGFIGSVTTYWFAAPISYTLGASGAIFGLFGAALVIFLRQKRDVTSLLVLLGLNLVITFTVGNISWQAHIGGLIAGLVLGWGIAYAPRDRRTFLTVGCMVLIFAIGLAGTVVRTMMLT